MKLKKAVPYFETLKHKHKKGKIGDVIFEQSVNNIEAVSDNGDNWKVDVDGVWYRNIDGSWIKDNANQADKKSPQTLLQLFIMIFKNMLTQISKKMIFMLIIALVTFLIHTYLVIYPNGGYAPSNNSILSKILALRGNKTGGVAFWTILSFLAVSLFRKIRTFGFKKIFTGFYAGPIRVFKSVFSKSKNYTSFLIIITTISLLLAQFLIKNSAIAFMLIITAFLAIITFKSDLSYLVLRLGYSDFLRLFKKKTGNFDNTYFDGLHFSIIISMTLYILLPYRPVSVYLFALLAIALLFYKKYRKSHTIAPKLMLLGIVALNLLVIFMRKTYADDGGVDEAGGLIPWVTSPGALTAVSIGLPPSIGAGIGGLIGLVTSATDFTDTFTDLGSDEGEGSNISIDDDYNTDEILEDLYDSLFGNLTDKVEGLIGLGELGIDLSVDFSDFILTSSVLDKFFDGYDSFIPEWFETAASNTANEVFDYMGVTKDFMSAAGLIPKNSPIPGIMDVAGILKDTFDNIGLGDSMAYAAVKSFMSNKVKSYIFDEVSPSLVWMDALTTILVGGSDASKIISPGKTIQGGANFIMDKLADTYNGTNDVKTRLKNGDYGGVWKVADESTEVLADAVYNPKEFKKDFDNVMTSDEFYDGMYDTNEKLWKPAEGSWAIKKGACYVGKKTFEGFIKMADGIHKFSSWFGSKV